MRRAFGGIPAGHWTPVSLHASDGTHNTLKEPPCENVETSEWKQQKSLQNQTFGAGRGLGSPHNPLDFFITSDIYCNYVFV